jgi:hypothetical protein
MLDTGEVSPSKITNLLRRFEQTLARTHVSFHEFLTDQTSRNRVFAADTGLRSLLGYLDPTGVKAARNVDRQRRA